MLPLHRPLVLDGGMSNALEDRGHDLSGPLWTARVLQEAPGEVAAVHQAYLEAGADVITAASYQALFELLAVSVLLAREARDASGRGWVAASVGPYGAALADGSEYTGRYGVPAGVLRDFHAPRLEELLGAEPDVLAVETVPDVDEALVLVELLEELGANAWLSYSVEGGRTRAGQELADAFALASSPAIVAVGVNCCAPSDVDQALAAARACTDKPLVAYPNSGEAWSGAAWTGPTRFDATAAPRWIDAGACLVGGCCRVGPAEIAAVAALVGTSP